MIALDSKAIGIENALAKAPHVRVLSLVLASIDHADRSAYASNHALCVQCQMVKEPQQTMPQESSHLCVVVQVIHEHKWNDKGGVYATLFISTEC